MIMKALLTFFNNNVGRQTHSSGCSDEVDETNILAEATRPTREYTLFFSKENMPAEIFLLLNPGTTSESAAGKVATSLPQCNSRTTPSETPL